MLTSILTGINQLCEVVQDLRFEPPGMFTNAIISKPPITKLLKDAAEHEQALYKITKTTRPALASTTTRRFARSSVREYARQDNTTNTIELKPERRDGKSTYIENSFTDTSDVPRERKTAVRIPEVVKVTLASDESIASSQQESSDADTLSSPSKKQKRYSLIPEGVSSTDDVNDIYSRLIQAMQKYPTLVSNRDELHQNITAYQSEYNHLCREIKELEEVVLEQRSQLNQYNVGGIGSPIREGQFLPQPEEEEEVDIDDLITQEEEEIRQLEDELNEKSKLKSS